MLSYEAKLASLQVLRCVDWGDAREARAAGELMARWARIGLADALELLSPAFTNPEVCPSLDGSDLHVHGYMRRQPCINVAGMLLNMRGRVSG